MANYLAPGVYVEEVSSGSRPIEGVGTAVAGFVGFTEKGPVSEPTLVTNWTQYTGIFGGFVDNAHLPHAMYGYFLNGGGTAYVMRLPDGRKDTEERIARAAVPAAGDDKRSAFTLRARAAAATDDISVTVGESTQADGETFRIDVVRGGKVEESFDNLTTKRGPNNVATVISRNSKLVELEDAKTATVVAPKKDA
ncbi:MAG: phage tail sheath family protein, partial [Actinophytocola sp.]